MTDNRSSQKQWQIMQMRFNELAKQGMSALAISATLNAEFEFGITRNAVIGKLHRSGFRPSGIDRRGPPKGTKTAYQIKRRGPDLMPRKRPVRKPRPLIPGEPVHILNLKPHHCRWIEGDAKALLYCGETISEGTPWCPAHLARAYDKSRVR